MDELVPKLRNVNKTPPPYPFNKFPKDFPFKVGEQLIYILATRGETNIEGKEWEAIFASSVGATWKPSNVGLDDIIMENTAWGAKSVLSKNPFTTPKIRLISGRNDLLNSYDFVGQPGTLPNEHGKMVLGIYNDRVSSVRKYYKHLRTVVLIRSQSLLESSIYEIDTVLYDHEKYYWEWGKGNRKNNLYGYSKLTKEQKFTWQSGGTQFTIFENVPKERLIIKIRKPEIVPKDFVLDKVGFSKDWITVSYLV